MDTTTYAIALGSNRWGRHGDPRRTVLAALDRVGGVIALSPIVASAPLGPSIRRYANAVALIDTHEAPPDLLARLKGIERALGRRPGRRWGTRVIDLDIVLWSGGSWVGRGLVVPHVQFRTRDFVLGPLAMLIPGWRDPLTGRTMRQLRVMVDRARPRA